MDPTTALLLTQQEAAAALAVSVTTVWRMYRAGKLATCRIGGRTLITAESVREYVDSHTERVDAVTEQVVL